MGTNLRDEVQHAQVVTEFLLFGQDFFQRRSIITQKFLSMLI